LKREQFSSVKTHINDKGSMVFCYFVVVATTLSMDTAIMAYDRKQACVSLRNFLRFLSIFPIISGHFPKKMKSDVDRYCIKKRLRNEKLRRRSALVSCANKYTRTPAYGPKKTRRFFRKSPRYGTSSVKRQIKVMFILGQHKQLKWRST